MSKSIDREQIRLRLEGCRGAWQAIADKAQVSHSWLSKFVNGHIPNPGYETLERVYDCLEEGGHFSTEQQEN